MTRELKYNKLSSLCRHMITNYLSAIKTEGGLDTKGPE